MYKNTNQKPRELKDTAVVTIDIQQDYFPGGAFALWQAERAGKIISRLLSWARGESLPIIHVRHTSLRPEARFLLPDTPGQALHPCLNIQPGEPIVDKNFPSSFRETDLDTQLKALGITTIIWAGMITWMCVDTTLRAAYDLGYKNILIADGTASGWLPGKPLPVPPWQSQRAYLSALGIVHAQVRTLADYLNFIDGRVLK